MQQAVNRLLFQRNKSSGGSLSSSRSIQKKASGQQQSVAAQTRSRVTAHLAETVHVSAEKRLEGLRGLLAVSQEEGAEFIVFETKGVTEAFLKAAESGESDEVREIGLDGLASLASAPENATRLFEAKGALDILLRETKSESNALRRAALSGLVNLATAPENMLRLFETPGVVQAFLQAAKGGATLEIKILGLTGLANLAYAPGKKKQRLYEGDGVVESMVGGSAPPADVAELRKQRKRRHSIIANAPENAARLFETEGVVDVLLDAAQNGETAEIKQYALGGLASLAYAPINKERLYARKGVVDAMLQAAQSGENADIVLGGLKGLWSLSKSIPVAEGLVEDHDVLNVLKHTTFPDESVLSVMYLNFAVAPKARGILKADPEAVEIIEKLTESEVDDRSPVAAKLTLAILKGSEGGDSQQLRADNETFKIILEILDGAITGKEVMFNTWPLNQPLMALRYLTTLESNRVALGTEWLSSLPIAVTKGMAQEEPSVAECAFACLSQYALDPAVLPTLQKDANSYISSAEQVINKKKGEEPWMSAIRAASGLIFTLKGEAEQKAKGKQDVDERQIMISYAWGPPPHRNKEIAVEVETFLQERGYAVWRDERMMHADIMMAMAEGVSKSSTIVVLVTKTYMESANCRRELTYAINCKKKIIPLLAEAGYNHLTDGWLGVSIGSLLYYDISSKATRKEIMGKMVKTEFDAAGMNGKASSRFSRHVSMKPKRTVNSEAEVRAWGEDVELPNEVIEGLIKQGYVTNELFEGLVGEPASELVKLLHLELSAHGTKLRMELKNLFPYL